MEKEIIIKEVETELVEENKGFLKKVRELEVTNEVSNSAMVILVGIGKKLKKGNIAKLAPSKIKAKETYDEIRNLENSLISSIEEGIKLGSSKSVAWVDVETEKREAKQRKLDAEHEEKERKEAERVAKLEEKAEAKGKVSTAVEKIIPVQTVAKVYKPAGVSYAISWSAELVNIMSLCKSIVEGKVSPNAVLPNMPVLNSLARISKCESHINGVKFVKKRTVRNG